MCAEFINQHSNNQRTAKEVLAKAKEMQSGNFAMSSLKEEVNKLAYENLQKGTSKRGWLCPRQLSNIVIQARRKRFWSASTKSLSAVKGWTLQPI